MNRRGYRGVSLAETIVACFVLTFGMLVSVALFHTALQHSVRIDRKQLAARIAEQQIESLRAWSRASHGTNGELAFSQGWSTLEGAKEDPDNPGYVVETEFKEHDLYSPASEFEKINFAALEDENVDDDSTDKRTLDNSAYLATITVSWGDGPGEKIVTRTIFGDPVRDHGWDPEEAGKAISLEYQQSSSWEEDSPELLAANASLRVRAFIEDKNGAPVDNAVITWYVDPDSTGNGTINSNPDNPEQATFINVVEVDPDPSDGNPGLKTQTGGSVRLVARVRLGGIEAFKKTPPIDLGE